MTVAQQIAALEVRELQCDLIPSPPPANTRELRAMLAHEARRRHVSSVLVYVECLDLTGQAGRLAAQLWGVASSDRPSDRRLDHAAARAQRRYERRLLALRTPECLL